MTTESVDHSDTTTRPSLNLLLPGFDGHKATPADSVAGSEIVFTNSYGSRVSHRFEATAVEWRYDPGAGDPHPVASGRSDYEAFDVAPGLVYAQFHHRRDVPNTAVSLVVDHDSGHTLAIVSTIGEPSAGRTRVRHNVLPGVIEGREPDRPGPAPTTALVGRRLRWSFSDVHRYEHIHLEPHSYTWHCVAGPEAGLADTVECTTYRLRPGIHVLASREKVNPWASVTVTDLRDHTSLRAHGAVFGLDETGELPTHLTFGAVGEYIGPPARTGSASA
ncbi:MoaF C-terminal domain-containing protein [Pseudonocardia sp.]|uniref:MoaF C-terminal domain-containing protein n=1 Tax=Pseudonocardia sp. TaxID=60912 RepID=UPI003D0F093E